MEGWAGGWSIIEVSPWMAVENRLNGPLAQLVEQETLNLLVESSSLSGPTNLIKFFSILCVYQCFGPSGRGLLPPVGYPFHWPIRSYL